MTPTPETSPTPAGVKAGDRVTATGVVKKTVPNSAWVEFEGFDQWVGLPLAALRPAPDARREAEAMREQVLALRAAEWRHGYLSGSRHRIRGEPDERSEVHATREAAASALLAAFDAAPAHPAPDVTALRERVAVLEALAGDVEGYLNDPKDVTPDELRASFARSALSRATTGES